MENFIKEIKDHNLNKALALEVVGRTSDEDFNKAIDEVADTLNKSFLDGLVDEQVVEVDFKNLDAILEKARPHKYYKREGSPGNYKYYYTKEQYEKEKGSGGDKGFSEKLSDMFDKISGADFMKKEFNFHHDKSNEKIVIIHKNTGKKAIIGKPNSPDIKTTFAISYGSGSEKPMETFPTKTIYDKLTY